MSPPTHWAPPDPTAHLPFRMLGGQGHCSGPQRGEQAETRPDPCSARVGCQFGFCTSPTRDSASQVNRGPHSARHDRVHFPEQMGQGLPLQGACLHPTWPSFHGWMLLRLRGDPCPARAGRRARLQSLKSSPPPSDLPESSLMFPYKGGRGLKVP